MEYVLDLLADGMSVDQVLNEYGSLTDGKLCVCLALRVRLSAGRYVDAA